MPFKRTNKKKTKMSWFLRDSVNKIFVDPNDSLEYDDFDEKYEKFQKNLHKNETINNSSSSGIPLSVEFAQQQQQPGCSSFIKEPDLFLRRDDDNIDNIVIYSDNGDNSTSQSLIEQNFNKRHDCLDYVEPNTSFHSIGGCDNEQLLFEGTFYFFII